MTQKPTAWVKPMNEMKKSQVSPLLTMILDLHAVEMLVDLAKTSRERNELMKQCNRPA